MQLGETVEEVFPGGIRTFEGAAIAGQALACHRVGDVSFHIGAGAEATSDAGQNDDADVGVIVACPHVFAHLGHCTVFLSRAEESIHALRPIELNP